MKGMTQIVEILSALFFAIIIVQIVVKYDIMRSKLEFIKGEWKNGLIGCRYTKGTC